MSKDFYSDNHTIQVGAPDSGNGNLNIKTEDDCNINAIGDLYFYGDSSVRMHSGDGTILHLSTEAELNNTLVITSGGSVITGNVEIEGDVAIDGDISITGVISQAEGWTRSGNIDITTSLGGDINLTATGFFAPLGSGNLNLTSATTNLSSNLLDIAVGDSITITAEDDITITAGTGDNGVINIKAGNGVNDPYITLTEDTSVINIKSRDLEIETLDDVSITCDVIDINGKVVVTGFEESDYLVTFSNTSSDSNVDILRLNFENITTPSGSNNWIRFSSDGSSKGAIQGAGASSNYYALYVPLNSDPADYAENGAGDPLTTSAGYAQFVSGNADFGEWVPLGDEDEWNLDEDSKKEFLKSSILQVEEGAVLYVREAKAWRKGPGRGMVVTNRSIVVGNQNYKEDGRLGVILSFTGQVPVLVQGVVEDGDLLLPVEDTNHCYAIPAQVISFSDYRRAIGTAWGKKLTPGIGKIICAIGVK